MNKWQLQCLNGHTWSKSVGSFTSKSQCPVCGGQMAIAMVAGETPWSEARPNEVGWYWIWHRDGDASLARICQENGHLLVRAPMLDLPEKARLLSSPFWDDYEWQPVPPPLW
ncbi:MAG: hypothetical protein ACE5JG_06550 [Planctomycetota bacterium]